MNNEQIDLDLNVDQDFDLEAFEQELIEEYGSLEAAYLDLSDRLE